MKYYAIVKVRSRGEERLKKVSYDFPEDENRLVIAAFLVHAGFFNKKDAEENYQKYLKEKANPTPLEPGDYPTTPEEENFFYSEIATGLETDFFVSGQWYVGEEWEMGMGTTKEEAEKNFVASQAALSSGEVGEENWE